MTSLAGDSTLSRVACSRHKGGSGLGLAIAKALVVAHRGRLAVRSAAGQGTTAVVSLPLLPALGRRRVGPLERLLFHETGYFPRVAPWRRVFGSAC